MFTWRELHFQHDTALGSKVEVGLHAVAIDEHRRPFAPTFWTQKIGEPLPDGQTCEQVWFAGAHSDVGGGYSDHRLSDVAMVWMMARVTDLTGLRFDPRVLEGLATPDVAPEVTNSLSWVDALSRLLPFNRPMLRDHAQEDRPARKHRRHDPQERQRGDPLEHREARGGRPLSARQPAGAPAARCGHDTDFFRNPDLAGTGEPGCRLVIATGRFWCSAGLPRRQPHVPPSPTATSSNSSDQPPVHRATDDAIASSCLVFAAWDLRNRQAVRLLESAIELECGSVPPSPADLSPRPRRLRLRRRSGKLASEATPQTDKTWEISRLLSSSS